ncbi:Ni2+-binding GTPase involved in regulation of expression and maturation of urease and hydrogenase [Mariprofundus aestuarium]|uniref:Hydrogenase maturation factor HypB n=1 Tax=Mariprofundus aestuarium TaxID=1921086 RepID=A0A2K8KWE5_MARES|nr:GTP-binding protein [Mariprofundus aestuarium]ATX79178.1 Ni2+-binding GTPase involved in regulation of expression and maturation of urease and hydrogenase [Mariprofundus aestuarium]
MKLIICAGPPTCGKTTVLKQVTNKLLAQGRRVAYLKEDVQFAEEATMFSEEFGIPSRAAYSGEICPDHCHVLILKEAVEWAEKNQADIFIVETAGLCLRCAPYVEGGLAICVLEVTSGMNLPRKIGPMLTLADIAVVTKIDLVSQAEREVFRMNLTEVAPLPVIETDALHGINIDRIVREVEKSPEIKQPMILRGNPPLAVCTICAGKKEIGWENHFGVVRTLESDPFYQGE